MRLIERLKKNEMLVFWNRCRLHAKEPEFRKWMIKDYYDPKWVRIDCLGEEYRGCTVYQIGAFGCEVGFFAEFLYALIRLYYADERGFKPYIYWGDNFLYYESEGVRQETNAFQYYFCPVSEVTSAEHAAHLIKASDAHITDVQDCLHTHGYAVTEEYINALSSMIRKYIQYNSETEKYLRDGFRNLIGDRKALAVHFRGTDYRRQYNNHPIFITPDQEIEKVRELLDEKRYDVVFLATDEQEAVRKFKEAFGDQLVYFEDTWRASEGDESIAYSHSERSMHKYKLGLEVLRDQYMLTRCDGLVCGISNLTLTARMMRRAWYERDYDDLVILGAGLNKNNNNFCDAGH